LFTSSLVKVFLELQVQQRDDHQVTPRCARDASISRR
jgi:hypothetical protein